MSYSATDTESMAAPCSLLGPLLRKVSTAACDSQRSKILMRVGSTGSAVIATSRHLGVASARDQVTHDGDCLVPIVRIDLGVLGDDRHEEVLAFKTPGGR